MEEVYIPQERIKLLRANTAALEKIMKLSNCSIEISKYENALTLIGKDAYCEFTARNIITAIGRGFDVATACLLASDNYYFSYIDLRQLFNEKRMSQIKARIIGKNGKTKIYMETLTSAKISVYGHTVGFIGKINEIEEAETAVRTLIEGSTHRLAYEKMEARHRKNKSGV